MGFCCVDLIIKFPMRHKMRERIFKCLVLLEAMSFFLLRCLNFNIVYIRLCTIKIYTIYFTYILSILLLNIILGIACYIVSNLNICVYGKGDVGKHVRYGFCLYERELN